MKTSDVSSPVPDENPFVGVQPLTPPTGQIFHMEPVREPETHPLLVLEKRIAALEQRVQDLEKGIFADRDSAFKQGTGRFLL